MIPLPWIAHRRMLSVSTENSWLGAPPAIHRGSQPRAQVMNQADAGQHCHARVQEGVQV